MLGYTVEEFMEASNGSVVGIAHPDDLESGIAMIALRSKAPLVPAYMSAKPRLFRRIHLYYGAPIQTAALAEKGINKETCDELLENIRQCYRDMAQKYGADFPGKMKD